MTTLECKCGNWATFCDNTPRRKVEGFRFETDANDNDYFYCNDCGLCVGEGTWEDEESKWSEADEADKQEAALAEKDLQTELNEREVANA